MNPLREGRVEANKNAMKPGIAVTLAAALKSGSEFDLARGAGKEAFCQRAEVETRSPGYDGQAGKGGDVAERGASETAILARGKRLVRIDNVDQVMG
jgi:hypothetical protein